ncbi:MAG TPA: hypothetical protein VFL30_09920 [Rhodanobacteraceae bacterium]|nr:hypothetical protein [Rhodanobacteraceae bacterium]
MFAKRTKPSSRRQPSTDDDSQTEQSGSESRADAIERLESELEEQRAATQRLQEALDAARFKTETLEKSYAKQLGAAREKLASTQAELKEKDEILAGLGGPHEHTLRELSDATAVIKVLKSQLEQMRKLIPQRGHGQAREFVARAPRVDTADGTINALIANTSWEKKKPGVGTGQATATVDEGPELPREEMLSPDLVFTANDKEDDGR